MLWPELSWEIYKGSFSLLFLRKLGFFFLHQCYCETVTSCLDNCYVYICEWCKDVSERRVEIRRMGWLDFCWEEIRHVYVIYTGFFFHFTRIAFAASSTKQSQIADVHVGVPTKVLNSSRFRYSLFRPQKEFNVTQN